MMALIVEMESQWPRQQYLGGYLIGPNDGPSVGEGETVKDDSHMSSRSDQANAWATC